MTFAYNSPVIPKISKEHHSDPSPEALQPDVVPWVLRKDTTSRRRAGGGKLGFSLGVFFLAVALLFQYVWFRSVEISERFPDASPWVVDFCGISQCVVPEGRDPGKIQVLERVVRDHPKYEGALLVSARLVNTLPRSQPFPRMRFTLFNTGGDAIGTRTFEPEEYLAGSVDIAAGMASLLPVQVVMDVLAMEDLAASFGFEFL